MKGQSSFNASRTGKCRGCHTRYFKGDNIWSPAKGGGAYHICCQPELTVREATIDDLVRVRVNSELRKRGIYSS